MPKIRLYLVLFFITTLVVFANAQEQPAKVMVSLAIGPSIPIGNFGSDDFSNLKSGNASVGVSFDLSLKYKLEKKYGLVAMLRSQTNSFDEEAYEKRLRDRNPDPALTWSVSASKWRIGGLLVGAYGTIPVGNIKENTLQARGLVGYLNATSPEINAVATGFSQPVFSKTVESSGGGFAHLFGVTFTRSYKNNFSWYASLDYLGAGLGFNNVVNSSNSFGQTLTTTSSNTQSYTTINMGIGISYLF